MENNLAKRKTTWWLKIEKASWVAILAWLIGMGPVVFIVTPALRQLFPLSFDRLAWLTVYFLLDGWIPGAFLFVVSLLIHHWEKNLYKTKEGNK